MTFSVTPHQNAHLSTAVVMFALADSPMDDAGLGDLSLNFPPADRIVTVALEVKTIVTIHGHDVRTPLLGRWRLAFGFGPGETILNVGSVVHVFVALPCFRRFDPLDPGAQQLAKDSEGTLFGRLLWSMRRLTVVSSAMPSRGGFEG